MSTIFHDCFGREINVGDVLAHGHRERDKGSIGLGVVRAIDDKGIHTDALQRGTWINYADGSDHQWWLSGERGNTWRIVRKRHTIGTRRFITGMSEAELRKIAELDVARTVEPNITPLASVSTPIRDITPRLPHISEEQGAQ